MINLLPNVAKKQLNKEQWLRLISVWFVVGTFLCGLAALLTWPTQVLLDRYESSMTTEKSLASELVKRREEVEKDLAETKIVLNHLTKETSTRHFSSLIFDIDNLAGEEVRLTHFNFDDKDKLILSGVATTRSALSSFRGRLEDYDHFKEVELPLSSLVKDNDVPFSITITLQSL